MPSFHAGVITYSLPYQCWFNFNIYCKIGLRYPDNWSLIICTYSWKFALTEPMFLTNAHKIHTREIVCAKQHPRKFVLPTTIRYCHHDLGKIEAIYHFLWSKLQCADTLGVFHKHGLTWIRTCISNCIQCFMWGIFTPWIQRYFT